jgi:myo-inositol-1-phosphate synthase
MDTSGATGLWLVGARGSVATTAAVGALGIGHGLAGRTGLVTERPDVAGAPLPRVEDLVVGGHDISTTTLSKRAEALAEGGVLPPALVRALGPDLEEVDRRIRQVSEHPHGPQAARAGRIAADLRDFARRERCDRVVVVNVSSTESPLPSHPAHEDLSALESALRQDEPVLGRSSLYAYAAFRAGCAYVDFTPGAGARLPALRELAEREGVPWAGSDGKTGETLLKSVLAPMFAARGLKVRSWAGTNLLGGGDGATLADPGPQRSKARSKSRTVQETLGYPVEGPLHIDYVPNLGDWKTAWDHISFEGFLGVGMTLQFTWQGCDSALAAPLVLDLARLVAAAHAAGYSGPLPALAFFFKDPVDCTEHGLAAQYELLVRWAAGLPGRRT